MDFSVNAMDKLEFLGNDRFGERPKIKVKLGRKVKIDVDHHHHPTIHH